MRPESSRKARSSQGSRRPGSAAQRQGRASGKSGSRETTRVTGGGADGSAPRPPVDAAVGSAEPVATTPVRRTSVARLTAQTSIVAAPATYSPDDLRDLRLALGVSQSVFAGLVGVSKSLVEHWEAGIRVPSAMARRLLDAIASEPRKFLKRLTRESPR